MDFKLPEYTYDEKKAVRTVDYSRLAGYRKILKECLDNIDKQIEEIGYMQDVEVIREELVDIQQTVIDMGGLIEKVKGEANESVRSLEKFCDVENKAIGIDRKYYSDRLKCCTDKLVYIQSFELEEFNESNERKYKNMASFCTVPGVINADVAYVQSYNMRNMYIKKLTEFAGKETENIWNDKIYAKPEWMTNREHCIANGNGKKKILFYTSISGLMQNSEIAAGKIRNVLDIFKQYSEQIEIIWCVQSLLDTVIKDIDKKLYEQIIAIRNEYKIEQIGHVCSDKDKDMLSSFYAYYGDTSSVA